MPLKFNPLLRGGFDESKRILDDLEDVSTAGTVNGKVLAFQSGTWKPAAAAGGGDMLKSVYVTGQGTVYNASRLEGETLATVQAHGVDAGTITQGTIGLARVPVMDDAHIPDLETLSYGGTFAEAQIPDLPTSKIISGTLNADRIPILPTDRYGSAVLVSGTRAMTGNLRFLGTNRKVTFGSDGGIVSANALSLESEGNGIIIKSDLYPEDSDSYDLGINTKYWQSIYAYVGYIPSLNANIVNAGTLNTSTIQENVGGAGVVIDSCLIKDGTVANSARLENNTLASVRDHNVAAAKITSGTIGLARIPSIDDARIPNLETLSYGGTFADAQIPDLDTLSYSAAFGTAQIPSIGAYKISSGSFNADRIPTLPTTRITTGTFDGARIPDIGVVAINYVIDGGGTAIGTGIKGDLEVPFTCHVDRWTLLADQHGSIVVDVWRDSYVNFAPTDADSMPGTTNMPAISGTIAAQGTDLSGWGTQGIAAGDVLRYNVDSCTSIERCTLALKATKK